MAPVVRLARQVRHRDQLLGLAPPLAPDYAADEIEPESGRGFRRHPRTLASGIDPGAAVHQ